MRSSRVPITAKVAAKMFGAVSADRVLTVDLHADQIQGFFDIPVDNVYASPLLLADIWRAYGTENLLVVSPDVGGVVRARAVAKRLDDADLAIIDKRRPRANVATVMNIIGDVEGKDCVLVDDIVDTAGTLCAAAAALKQHGANKVAGYCTHPVLGPAVDNLNNSVLDELVVTDTIPLSSPQAQGCSKIRQLSVAELLAETDPRIAFGDSGQFRCTWVRVSATHRLIGAWLSGPSGRGSAFIGHAARRSNNLGSEETWQTRMKSRCSAARTRVRVRAAASVTPARCPPSSTVANSIRSASS